jgi:hypothetical protein
MPQRPHSRSCAFTLAIRAQASLTANDLLARVCNWQAKRKRKKSRFALDFRLLVCRISAVRVELGA